MRVAKERNIMSCKSTDHSEDSCYREGEVLDRSVRDVTVSVEAGARLGIEAGAKLKRHGR